MAGGEDPAFAETAATTAPDDKSPATEFPRLGPARYALGAEVGRGGLGRVLHAHDDVLDRDVAIKELHATGGAARTRFVREVMITARLQHPSIVPIYEAGTWTDGSPYYAMKLVNGRPLAAALAGAHTLPERLALVPIVLAVADALAYAHSKRIVHRDLKPANILVGEFGETVVIDWGLAKDLSIDDADALDVHAAYRAVDRDQTVAGGLYGTPAYMSPEQASGGDTDERADVYAIGAILYHVIAGVGPHRGDHVDAMLEQITTGKITPLAKLEPHVPADLAALVGKAMQRDPAERYPSAKQLADDLRRFQTGQLVASHRYTARERIARFVRRHRVPVATVAIAVCVLTAGATFAIHNVMTERDRANAAAHTATERSDELEIEQAHALARTNPTRAVALLKRHPDHWREVRAIAADARSAGVAYSLPASAHTESLVLDATGRHALSAGSDGVVRVHDLAAHTTRELVRVSGPATARFTSDGFVVTRADALDFVATDGRVTRSVRVDAGIAAIEQAGRDVYVVDRAGALWRSAGDQLVREKVPEPLHGVVASPDGQWLVGLGRRHAQMLDRTSGTWTEILRGDARRASWSDDNNVAIALEDTAVAVVVDDEGPRIYARLRLDRPFAVLTYNLHLQPLMASGLYTEGITGITPLAGARELAMASDCTAALGGDVLLVACSTRMDSLVTYRVQVPEADAYALAGSRKSPFVVTAARDHLLVWNIDQLRGQLVTPYPLAHAAFGRDRAVIVTVADTTLGVELPGGRNADVGRDMSPGAIASAPTEHAAIVVDRDTRAASYFRDDAAARVIARDVDGAVFLDDRTAVVTTASPGVVALVDVATGTRTELVRGARLVDIAIAGRTIAAAFADGTVWRTGGARITLPARSLAALADGSVVITTAVGVVRWQPDGTQLPVAVMPARWLARSGDDVIVATADHVFQLGAMHMMTLPAGLEPRAVSADGELVVVRRGEELEVHDPRVGLHWVIAHGEVFGPPTISPDGRYVFANAPGAFVWTLDLPGDAAATMRWLDSLTNATLPDPTGQITW